MRINPRQAFLASTILIFAGGAAAAATNDAPPATTQGPKNSVHGKSNAPDTRTMQQRVEQRITEMHSSLHVTAAQQPQWDAFAKVMRDNAKQMDATLVTDADTLAKMTAVEQMQSYAEISDQHAKDVASLVPAFQGLYDVMSPEQKLNADAYFRAQAQRGRHGKKA